MFVIIEGNLTKDPELKYSKDGLAYCNVRIAANAGPDNKGEPTETEFFDTVCFRNIAENLASSLGKGDRVVAYGNLKYQSWISKETGDKNKSAKIEAREICPSLMFATAKISKVESAAKKKIEAEEPPDINDDDLPF